MSQWALMTATQDYLREQFKWKADHCQVMADGQPPPMCGQYFVAVHQGEWRTAQDVDHGLDEYFGVSVTLTWRITRTPRDKWGVLELAKVVQGRSIDSGFLVLLEAIRARIHRNYGILDRANALIGAGEQTNGFHTGEPLLLVSPGAPAQRIGGEWFSADRKERAAGIAQTLAFGGARRMQANLDGLS